MTIPSPIHAAPGADVVRDTSVPLAAYKPVSSARLNLRQAETQQRRGCAIMQAVAKAEERQAEMLEILRDRAWQLFAAAGCPRCRAHTVKPLDTWQRLKLAAKGRLLGALRHSKSCVSCGRAW